MQELQLGLNDVYAGLRKLSIDELAKSKFAKDKKILSEIELIASTEKHKKTKASALLFLANTMDLQYQPLYNKLIADSGSLKEIGRIRKLHMTEPLDGIAESVLTVRYGDRLRSLVMRFEGIDQKWL